MDTLWQDLRQALRILRKNRGFTIVAVLTLALGVGANTAIFSIVNAVLIRPLPFPDADRLMAVWARTETVPMQAASYPEFVDWRGGNRTFEGLAAWRGQSVNLTGAGEPERLLGSFVSADFLRLLRVPVALGRAFDPAETEPGTAQAVAVISHGLWTRRFGGDAAIVGRSLNLNGRPFTVIGVLGAEFGPGRAPADAWFMTTEVLLPAAYFPNARGLERGQSEMLVIGRLRPGVTVAQARADLDVVARQLEQSYPETHRGRSVLVLPLREQLVDDSRTPLLVLLGAAGLVLLIACANVANLLLARATRRQGEIAVRAALGAGRRRLVRQLVTESLLLGLVAGTLGLFLGQWSLDGLVGLLPVGNLPQDLGLDRTVLLYALLTTLATGLMFGIAPALNASRADLHDLLKDAGSRSGLAPSRRRLADVLVVSEVALSVVLLVGAGLLLQSVLALQRVDPGFRPDHVLTLEFRLPPSKYREPAQIAAFFREALDNIRRVPGVESAALVRAIPFSGNSGSDVFEVEGRPEPPAGKEPGAQTNIVSPDYFRTMAIPVTAGRDFNERDTADAPTVVIVNATLAREQWPGGTALGKRIRLRDQGRWAEVIGVVGDVKHGDLTSTARAQAYTTHDQHAKIFASLVARTQGDPRALGSAVQRAIWSVDPDQPVWKLAALEQLLARATFPHRAISFLVLVFAGLALLLAGIGVYGVMSYAVSQRTREIGIRLALGARRREVVGLIVGRGMALAGVALPLGLAGAAALGRVLTKLLFGVRPLDPATFLAAALVLAAVAGLASYVPARRASRLDPVAALGDA